MPPEPGWQVAGSFEGSAGPGLLGQLNDWLFENERDGGLYQDLGNLSIGVGYDYGGVELDWDNDFQRRVVSAHEELPPGARLTAADLSGYREVSQARSRLRLTWDYLPDLVGDVAAGAQVEGGYVVGLARRPRPDEGSEPRDRLVRQGVGREYREFLHEHLHGTRKPLYLAAGWAGGVIDLAAGGLGSQLADTERAVVYFADYAEPAVLFPDLGLPLRDDLFLPDDDTLAPGDAVTYTAFVGVAPARLGYNEHGVKASWRRFRRLLRETTVERRDATHVLVRVRRSLSDGNEVIPLKVRPEVRWTAFSLGYTFFEARRDRFDETVDDVTYRIDLADPEGLGFFRRLLGASATVKAPEAPLEAPPVSGVQLLRSTRRVGPVRDRRLRAEFFSWFRYKWHAVATRHRIETPQLALEEIARQRSRELRKPFGRRRDYEASVVLTAQSAVEWKDPSAVPSRAAHSPGVAGPEASAGGAAAVTVETSIASQRVQGDDLGQLRDGLVRVLGLAELGPALSELEAGRDVAASGLTFTLRLSFGPQQIARLLEVSDQELWRLLAELLLGVEHREAWATPERRYQWLPIERAHGRPAAGTEHVSRAYDRLRGDRPMRAKGLGVSLAHLDSRTLFIKASRLADRLAEARRKLAAGACLPCVADLFAGASDTVLLQALLVSLAGGVGPEGGVGYALEVFTDQLARPVRFGNALVYTYRHQRRPEPVRETYNLRDAEPRLRAGEMLLPVAPRAGEPCWKLRLYSDLVFDDAMSLRLALRDARPGADATLEVRTVGLPEPVAIPAAPFVVARYLYDLPLDWPAGMQVGPAYTVLLRVLGPDGEPVSEEQELRLRLPEDWAEAAGRACPAALPAPPERQAKRSN